MGYNLEAGLQFCNGAGEWLIGTLKKESDKRTACLNPMDNSLFCLLCVDQTGAGLELVRLNCICLLRCGIHFCYFGSKNAISSGHPQGMPLKLLTALSRVRVLQFLQSLLGHHLLSLCNQIR